MGLNTNYGQFPPQKAPAGNTDNHDYNTRGSVWNMSEGAIGGNNIRDGRFGFTYYLTGMTQNGDKFMLDTRKGPYSDLRWIDGSNAW